MCYYIKAEDIFLVSLMVEPLRLKLNINIIIIIMKLPSYSINSYQKFNINKPKAKDLILIIVFKNVKSIIYHKIYCLNCFKKKDLEVFILLKVYLVQLL